MGARLQSKSLVPRFKGLNLAEILNLSIEEAAKIFENQKSILTKLERARYFGLGYVLLGQTMDSLSGGEMQRLNLILELKKADLVGCWYVLFHPSTGLHTPDIFLLTNLIKQMCEKGATFIAIENREEFLDHSDNVVYFA